MGRSEHTFYLYALKNRRIQSKSNVKATTGRRHTQRVQLSAFSRAVLAVFKRSSKFPNQITLFIAKTKSFTQQEDVLKNHLPPPVSLARV